MAKKITPTATIKMSTPVIKYIPGIKTKILGFLIPAVICIGVLLVILDCMDVGNTKEQNAWKAGLALIVYCVFSLRGFFTYRIFLELTPEGFNWRQGFPPFEKKVNLPYSEIQSLAVTGLTSTLIFTLKSGKELKLAPSFRRVEGEIAQVSDEEIGTHMSTVREIFYLKHEINLRMKS
jgi:hypothetical protein